MDEDITLTGKAKEAIGVQLTHDQVKRLSDKDVEKYTKRYEAYVGSKTTESFIDSTVFLACKAVGMSVKIKDIDAYQKELRNDYLTNKELSDLSGRLALQYGRLHAAANVLFITGKHIDFEGYLEEQQSTKNAGATAGAMLEQSAIAGATTQLKLD